MLSPIRTYLREQLQQVLGNWGYQLQRVTPHDARGDERSPRDLILEQAAPLRRNLLVEVPVSKCRTTIGTALNEKHPFVAATAALLLRSCARCLLEDYYKNCQPASPAEVLGIPEHHAPGFSRMPAINYVMPWHFPDPEVQARRRDAWLGIEAARYGMNLTMADGVTAFGPVSPKKVRFETVRLNELCESMTTQGFLRDDSEEGDIRGWLLTDAEGDWCILAQGGNHRLAVATALEIEKVPVRISKPPVKREEVLYWPQVEQQRISPEGALMVFDRVMKGVPPPACRFASTACD